MRIAVVGGSGFIGSHLLARLADIGEHQIISIDRASGTRPLPASVKTIQLDVNDTEEFRRVAGSVDILYCLMANSTPTSTFLDPSDEIRHSLLPVVNMIGALKDTSVKKFVFVSSGGSVYGRHDKPVDETQALKPFTPYSITKVATEHYLYWANAAFGLNYDIYRLSNVYGPGQHCSANTSGVIAAWMRNISQNKPIEIWGDGSNKKDFIYISDVCEIISRSVASQINHSDVYNVASGNLVSLNELAQLILRVTGSDLKVLHHREKPGDNKNFALKNAKVMKRHPDLTFTPIEKGIIQTWSSFQKALFPKVNRPAIDSVATLY